MTTWALAATIKAPLRDILDFAAYHLDLGAHRLFLYLDDPDPATISALKPHPKIRVFACDAAYWRRLGRKRPPKHQLRQTANATHAYARASDADWMIHIDVDEFLWPEEPLSDLLGRLDAATLCARVRPMEALAGDPSLFKGFVPAGPSREAAVERLYPNFGRHVKGGFLSHLAGKLFVRTGLGPVTVKIHNVFRDDEMNPGQAELADVALCHCHARSWEDWIAAFRYRHEKGAYRAELAPNRPREAGGLTLHEVLGHIEADQGEAGLRAFFDEVCAASPDLCRRLETEGLLRRCDLRLDAKRRAQFPEFG